MADESRDWTLEPQPISLRVEDAMTKYVETVPLGATFREVAARMRRQEISCVLIVDNDRPVGIVSERDMVRILAHHLEDGVALPVLAENAMLSPVITVERDALVDEAADKLSALGIRRLPVVGADGELVGLVTQTDLMAARGRELDGERQRLRNIVATRTRELEEVNASLRIQTLTDALLGIGNRRALEFTLPRTHAVALRYQRAYTAVLFDVDYFKGFNDTYGHLAGDETLKRVVGCIAESIRKADTLYRYGGDEFLLVLPETNLEGANILVGRLQKYVEQLQIPHQASEHKVVTVSCGLGVCDVGEGRGPSSWRDVVDSADEALYNAKKHGRNRIGLPGEPDPASERS